MRGVALAALGMAAATAVGGCAGSARTELPAPAAASVDGRAALVGGVVATTPGSSAATLASTPPTTASPFKTAGERFPLDGGTITALYPRMQWRPPKDAPPPAGQAWWLLPVEVCAPKDRPLTGGWLQASRFRLEVPGQGMVAPAAPVPPAFAKGALPELVEVAAGRCAEGTVTFLVGGEGHVESATYETGTGPLRWAT